MMNAPFAIDAAVFGARAIPTHGRLFLALAVLHVVAAFFTLPSFGPAWGAALEAVAAAGAPGAGAAEKEVVGPALSRLVPFVAFEFVLYVVSLGAVLRALVRDASGGGVFGLWLGADELRVAAVSLLAGAVVFAALLLGQMGGLALGAVIGAAQAGASAGVVLGLFAALWASVRLMPAAAASVGENALIVRGAWALTRGRFWPLVLALGLVFAVALVASSLVGAVFAPGPDPAEVDDLEAAFRALVATPSGRLRLALTAALNPVLLALAAGVGAYAYRALGPAAGFSGARPPA